MKLLESIFAKLQRHPKRILFPEGADLRVLKAAEEYVFNKLGVAIILGNKHEILQLAASAGVSLKRINIVDPSQSSDLDTFLNFLKTLPRYKTIADEEAEKIVTTPNYFAALMIQHGQADGMVGGALDTSGSLLRPLFQIVRPLPGVKSISGAMIMEVPNCSYGEEGVFCLADCAVIPDPSVEQLASIAVEAAKLMRQLIGRTPKVAMLSYSTKGTAQTAQIEKITAATVLARQYFMNQNLDIEIDGELQADAAIVPEIGSIKAPQSLVAGRANVLIFPDLASANIATKLIERLARADAFGQVLLGLDKPAAEVSRGATVRDILGVAAIVGLQAISYRKLYAEQGARYQVPSE